MRTPYNRLRRQAPGARKANLKELHVNRCPHPAARFRKQRFSASARKLSRVSANRTSQSALASAHSFDAFHAPARRRSIQTSGSDRREPAKENVKPPSSLQRMRDDGSQMDQLCRMIFCRRRLRRRSVPPGSHVFTQSCLGYLPVSP